MCARVTGLQLFNDIAQIHQALVNGLRFFEEISMNTTLAKKLTSG
jgi:hypothetical protein